MQQTLALNNSNSGTFKEQICNLSAPNALLLNAITAKRKTTMNICVFIGIEWIYFDCLILQIETFFYSEMNKDIIIFIANSKFKQKSFCVLYILLYYNSIVVSFHGRKSLAFWEQMKQYPYYLVDTCFWLSHIFFSKLHYRDVQRLSMIQC